MNKQAVLTAVVLSVLLVPIAPAAAAPAYVTDQLRLGVHAAPDTSDRSFANISSGDRVDILEESQYYALVRLADGREGWVKKNYLLAEKPAVLIVAEMEKARDDAIAELATLKSSLAERESRVSEIEQKIRDREEQARAEQDELAGLRAERLELMSRLDAYSFSVPGGLFFAAIAASIAAGFLIAWYWFDRRSRARHGGFRVY